jgi:omega-hydroxy-beta-dihydromenaquinone-9 sulfotransferase
MHPLSGSNIRTLVRALIENRGLSRKGRSQAGLALAATLARWPFTACERLYFPHRLARAGSMPPPIFIVGHWRSGTTHLYNMMSKAGFGFVEPLAAGMPWDLLGMVKMARPLLERQLPSDRFIDSIPVLPDSPQEDEVAIANMTRMSFYHALYFPRSFESHFNRGVFFDGCSKDDIEEWKACFVHFLTKVWLQQGRRHLLIKNPVYTARVAMLREIFPGAKFIHVYRNPYEVLQSMQNFYEKLLRQFALQDYGALPIDDVILKTYSRMMAQLIEDTDPLPEDTFIEIRYERLERDPLAEIGRIYQAFKLHGFAEARPALEAYLASVQSYKKNRYAFSEENLGLVEREWGCFLDRWQYRRPGLDDTVSLDGAVG